MRGRHKKDKHHRKPRSRLGDDSPRNVVKVPKHKHRAWHLLFTNMTPHQIADEINFRWLDPDYELIVVKRAST